MFIDGQKNIINMLKSYPDTVKIIAVIFAIHLLNSDSSARSVCARLAGSWTPALMGVPSRGTQRANSTQRTEETSPSAENEQWTRAVTTVDLEGGRVTTGPSDLSTKKGTGRSGFPFPVLRTSHLLLYLILRAHRQNLQDGLLCVTDEETEVRRD